MLSKEHFSIVRDDFLVSDDFVRTAHDLHRSHDFVCHDNSYLACRFMRRRGHKDVMWTNGVYITATPGRAIRHSWLSQAVEGQQAIVFELDPRQLRTRGGYLTDPIPDDIGGIAVIVDPDLVELADDLQTSRWIIKSKEVLHRYQPAPEFAPPNFDFVQLNEIDAYAREVHDHFLEQEKAEVID